MDAQAVLDFWFLPPTDAGYGQSRVEWFRKDAAFDAHIVQRFGDLIATAIAGGLREWETMPQGMLARIIVLDQLTRNAFRDTPQAFAGDTQALALARQLTESGGDQSLLPMQRAFAYLPFEHAEDLAMQARAVQLFQRLAQEHAGFDSMLDYALRHQDVINRFGRFPHRNAILGRHSTPEETDFLRQPGSSF
ncbi:MULTISPECIES: DUF924 family protein [unclassified Janthinobacterium]|uniref:DUF924 family protein n=1 Tax=unclassified Janthinobacterium TaxID=2610881 RepID=UPI0016164800|nr:MULTISPECIES: DUF924 family protein [unclassified Janthinobacterium]MBB5370184.1 uncharacterized protein (DUF924 family) [Janthinobacterium sp. K2C7]MBB5382990.1 uncharacterized protein (DUF924 family) [Janthinobacterium sp. K2Li3]MBB5388531.1 uncharacterized protein (DUF924 family) [Janthinobacterium sp. K2E3]